MMDVDSPVLDFVEDDFSAEQHAEMDHRVHAKIPLLHKGPHNVDFVLSRIAKESNGHLLSKYAANLDECENFLEHNPTIKDMILNSSSYQDVRRLKLLQSEPSDPLDHDVQYIKDSPEAGWNAQFVGDSANELWRNVQNSYERNSSTPGRHYYARYAAIVQSSGMGKSRTADEMSKSHFVIPVNLRKPKSSGHPPSDISVYRYLTESRTQEEAFLRSCAFLHALFLQTAKVVKGMEQRTMAAEFRHYMTEDMQFQAHGEKRVKFYDAVVTMASKCYDIYQKYFTSGEVSASSDTTNSKFDPSSQYMDRKLLQPAFPLCNAFQQLQKLMKPNLKFEHPSVVLVFDEIHTLTALPTDVNSTWTRFAEFRRTIRGLRTKSLFTLFLSTSGTLFSITPAPALDGSARMVAEGDVSIPCYALGFDQYAKKVDFSKEVTLTQVTSDDWFTSYGRPLWYPNYLAYASEVFPFAAKKLLGRMEYKCDQLSTGEQLACLAQRIPIEFLTAHYFSKSTNDEKDQVQSHMRVILRIFDNLEGMITTSPSEPILSEAASFIMSTNTTFTSPGAMQSIIKLAVNTGELGELMVALLLIIARDKAVFQVTGDNTSITAPSDNGVPAKGDVDSDMMGDDAIDAPAVTDPFAATNVANRRRWCSMLTLLEFLFHANIEDSTGWKFSMKGAKKHEKTLGKTFKHSRVYFTHFIKVHQLAGIGVDYLMHLIVRGAAILCGNGQESCDAIIPFLLRGDEIKRDNISVILLQVKNDPSYTATVKPHIFAAMDPHKLKIMISKGVPIIRFTFALASKTAAFKCVDSEYADAKGLESKKSYTTYDFWIAGLSSKFLVPVDAAEEDIWDSLLQTSRRWESAYAGGSKQARKLRKSMNPGVATHPEFWENWCARVPGT